MPKAIPTLALEQAWRERGHPLVAGVDEAGRGAWAGPVIAAAVILPLDDPAALAALHGVTDSKQLTARQRETLAARIRAHALGFGLGGASAAQIDRDGIISATRIAMQRAVSMVRPAPTALLIDAVDLRANVPLPQEFMPYGDTLSLSIAAASILAKVSRDRFMRQLDDLYPGYDFARHKGYGTAHHRARLSALGASPMHRRTFKPVAALTPSP